MKIWVYIKGRDEWEKSHSGNNGTFGTTNPVSVQDLMIFFYPDTYSLEMYQVTSVKKMDTKMYDMLDFYKGTMGRTLQPREFVEKYKLTRPKLCAKITDIMLNTIEK